jgi:hypothetical protein
LNNLNYNKKYDTPDNHKYDDFESHSADDNDDDDEEDEEMSQYGDEDDEGECKRGKNGGPAGGLMYHEMPHGSRTNYKGHWTKEEVSLVQNEFYS